MNREGPSRREYLSLLGTAAVASQLPGVVAQAQTGGPQVIEAADRVFLANEDSNTISEIDPKSNTVESTINLTSFDEDPRPPFRYVTGRRDAHPCRDD